MIRETHLIAAAAIGVLAATLILAPPAAAGTCSPVMGKGRGPDPATATTRAQHELIQQAARLGGKLSQQSTNCKKIDGGFVCKMTAVACPKKA
jgi:hypothetical protein